MYLFGEFSYQLFKRRDLDRSQLKQARCWEVETKARGGNESVQKRGSSLIAGILRQGEGELVNRPIGLHLIHYKIMNSTTDTLVSHNLHGTTGECMGHMREKYKVRVERGRAEKSEREIINII